MVIFRHIGNFNRTERLLNKLRGQQYLNILDRYGQAGVRALSSATPMDSGKTASSWTYQIERGLNKTIISWSNTNVNDGVNIAILLQYGHGTGTGGYVQGRDYINPAMQPIFDNLAQEAWKEVAFI